MKKLISVFLCVIMVFSLVSVSASAADKDLIITVASDLHYNSAKPAAVTEDYAHVTYNEKLTYESGLIIDAFLKEAASNESSVVLITGDITDFSRPEEYSAMAEKFKNFEQTSGKSVYVVPGNHEFRSGTGITPEVFAQYFADFGYTEAIAKDTNSASYVVDLPDGYRLLAIDSTKVGDGVHGMTEERAEWIEEQAAQAQKDGKKTIAMMHHNLVEHLILSNTIHAGSVIDKSYGLQEILTKYNVKYNFVGHVHTHDITTYTGENGNSFYSISTGALSSYPCPYRVVTFGDDVKVETRRIDSINMGSLKGVITDNCYNLATSDFTEYTKQVFNYGYSKTLSYYLTPENFCSLMGIDAEKDAEMYAIFSKLIPMVNEAFHMPIYTVDERITGKSLQSIGKKLDFEFPESSYKTSEELFLALFRAHVKGDENYGILSTEYTLLTSALTAALNYVLSDVTADEYATVLNFICTKMNINIPTNFYNYAANEITKAEGIEILLSAGLSAALLQFTTDDAPYDNNANLEGYDTATEDTGKQSLWDRIVSFFLNFFDIILRFFGVGN